MLLYENSQQRNPEKGQNRAQWAKSKNFFSKRGFKTLLNKTIFIFFAQKHFNNRKEYFCRRKCLKKFFWSQKIKKFKKRRDIFSTIFFLLQSLVTFWVQKNLGRVFGYNIDIILWLKHACCPPTPPSLYLIAFPTLKQC